MDWDDEIEATDEPTDLDVFDHLVKNGIIQIMHKSTELIEEEEEV